MLSHNGIFSPDFDQVSKLIYLLRTLSRPSFLIICVLFFVAATPFELAQSGYAYLIKASAMLGIVLYAVMVRNARTGRLNYLAIIAIVDLFLTNLFGWTDRILVALPVILAGSLLGQARGIQWDNEFRIIVIFYLILNAVGLIIALVSFYGFGQVIDLHNTIFPHESRAEGLKIIGRLSGFHNEPGTYSQWMMMSAFLFALISNQLYSKITVFIALTIVSTFSLWGFIGFGIMLSAFAVEIFLLSNKRFDIRLLIGFILFLALIATILTVIPDDIVEQGYQFFLRKGEMQTQSGIDKTFALEFFQREYLSFLIFGRPFEPGFCPACLSPQDAGIGMTGSYYLGIGFFLYLFLSMVRKIYVYWGMGFIIPFFMIFFWKAHIYEPLLWLMVGYVIRGPINNSSGGI